MAFKKDFIWGAATAAYQIEGAAFEDGRAPSVWDMFCREEGRVRDGHNGDTACDHYHRYKEDVALMKKMGLKAYRFSISWPRVLPTGNGEVNEKGLQFYANLVDELLNADIEPYVTLFHWDLPYTLYQRGGWMNPQSSDWFARYADIVARRFGDRVKNYITFNEPQCFVGLSNYQTEHAPGLKLPLRDNLQMAHNVLLAHGKAVQAIRAAVPGSKIGYAPTGTYYTPASESAADIEAARYATFHVGRDNWAFNIAWWSDPVLLGRFPEDGLVAFEGELPKIGADDLKTICRPLDFYGQNIYQSVTVKASANAPFEVVQNPVGHPRTAIDWPVTPGCLYWPPRFLSERYGLPLLITENGISCHDAVSLDGAVHDPGRIDYIQRHLRALGGAAQEGYDIIGYFYWSLMDNFEWAKGYNERFGLVHVDYATQNRTCKDSAAWYSEVIATNGTNL